ncbi:MAG: Aromatic/aminoadipate aminotransferase 1 [Alyxoria varia]|nr:MAG: Aromatic/aminoadipate aminotransferase 1 [Alyxoria varia]
MATNGHANGSKPLVPLPRLTSDEVKRLRTSTGKPNQGVAAKADIETLKGKDWNSHKPIATKDWTDEVTFESMTRGASRIKKAAQYISLDGMISLGGGLPAPDYFPFEDCTFKAPPFGGPFDEEHTRKSGTEIRYGKHDMDTGESAYDIATAYNYGQGHGSVQLLRFLLEHMMQVHNPPYRNWQTTMSIGTTSAVEMCLRMFHRPNMYILSEEYTFGTTVEAAKAMGIRTYPVAVDDEGLLPSSLDTVLTNWDPAANNGASRPFILYTVPTGQNPTGCMWGHERRRQIYAVAQKHDILIIEDEPYFFLQMDPYDRTGRAPPAPSTTAEYLSSLIPSLLSIDTDGRVLRLDSFSKVIAPGARIGWVTGPDNLIERIQRHSDVGTQSPSGFSQLALFKLLEEHWGHEGYLHWLMHIRSEYTRRRNVLLDACHEFLPKDLVDWKNPMAGMFQWLRVRWRKHPQAEELGLTEIEERLFLRAVEHRALLIRGSIFRADMGASGPGEEMFFRATYAAAPGEMIREAVRRFGVAVREEFGVRDVDGGEEGREGFVEASSAAEGVAFPEEEVPVDVKVEGANGHA